MKKTTLDEAIFDAKRFLAKAEALKDAAKGQAWTLPRNSRIFGRGGSDMTEPIRPEEVVKAKKESLPNEVIHVFNEAIAEVWNGTYSKVSQDAMADRIADRLGIDREAVFEKHYLDVEEVFRAAGWKVVYDKPAYCETYPATFEFTPRRDK